jgi:hypothetical protein
MFVSRFIGRLSGVAVMVALGCLTPAPLWANPADMLLVNGRIVTLDGTSSINEALAITGDRITATGSCTRCGGLPEPPQQSSTTSGGRQALPMRRS